jgi:hypothetical protein
MTGMDAWPTAERIADPPSVEAYWRGRRRLLGMAIGFAWPMAAVALLLGGVALLEGPPVATIVRWLATLLAGLVALLVGVEALLAVRLWRWARAEIGAYDYAWIERAQGEQPAVGEMAKQYLVDRGAVNVAELTRMWSIYTREQRKTAGERRRRARRRCAETLGLRTKEPAQSAASASAPPRR